MISIIDYGVGNIGSVSNMLRHIKVEYEFASTVEQIEAASALLLPGVGAFDFAMKTLHEKGFVEPLRRQALEKKVPILGICLGMQLLANGSEEGNARGLGLIDAEFLKFRFPPTSTCKVPHMGWNTLEISRDNPLLKQGEREERFYFVHSYYAKTNNIEYDIASCEYGHRFIAVYGKENIYGVQFHPEKSHKFGMRLLRNFAEFAC